MSAPRDTAGGPALSNVLPFPQTRKALRHYSRGMDAAGLLSLMLLDREGEAAPANVERFDRLDTAPAPSRSPEMLLTLLLLGQLAPSKRKNIRGSIRALAFGSVPDPDAASLHRLLTRGRL